MIDCDTTELCTYVSGEVKQLVVLASVIKVRLTTHRDVCQTLLHREDVATPTMELSCSESLSKSTTLDGIIDFLETYKVWLWGLS